MILIMAVAQDGDLSKSTLELVTAANGVAGGSVAALVVGPASAAKKMAQFVPRVLSVDSPELQPIRAEALTSVTQQAAAEVGADVVLMSANRLGQSVAPRLAVRLEAALLEEVTSLSGEGSALVGKRFSYLSRVTETVSATAPSGKTVVTVKPNVFKPAEPQAEGEVSELAVSFSEADTRVTVGARSAASGGRVTLEEASVVVAGGRGLGSAEAFVEYIEPLADALNAGIATTRAVVDSGWRPYSEQVGQTGKSVAPDLYFALGISGAVQHLSGMNRSKVIVAINKDADAPIFRLVDYGIVAGVEEVVPALLSALKERAGS